ncbi:unnamed protein product [Closterium sp. NIES-64]|nr:unnamed protein product [Closterium sp. NIES-64]
MSTIARAILAAVAPNSLIRAATAARSSVARQRMAASSLSVGGVGLSTSGLSAGVSQRRLTSFTDSELAGVSLAPAARRYVPLAVLTALSPRLCQVSVSFDPASPPLSLPSDLLLLAVFDSALSRDDTSAANFTGFAADAPGGAELASLDTTLSGALAELASDPDFRAKPGQVSQILRVPGQPFKRIGLLGLGKPDVLLKGEAGSWQGVGSAIAGAAKTNQASKVSLAFLGKPEAAEGQEIKAGSAVRGMVTGAIVGSFEDVRFKSEEKEKAKAERGVKELQVVGLGDAESLQRDVFEAERLAAGIILTKQLVNAPPNVLTPAVLADVAVNLTAAHADVLSARVLEKDECAALGMGSYLAVAEASAADNPPKFIHVTYTPPAAGDGGEGSEEKPLKKLALIGKGLTFDRSRLNESPHGVGHSLMPPIISLGSASPLALLLPWLCFSLGSASPLALLLPWLCFSLGSASPLALLLPWLCFSLALLHPLCFTPSPSPLIAPTSGGYNLKAGPGSMIHLMKFDMGGAAAVLGAAKAIAAIQPQGVQVHFIIAACENMVSGGGMKPGDIITASNGKTIEGGAGRALSTTALSLPPLLCPFLLFSIPSSPSPSLPPLPQPFLPFSAPFSCSLSLPFLAPSLLHVPIPSQVNNTDAEGRLTLADALLYAQQQGVEKIVDVATLTGACIIALGNDIAGLFTPSDELSAELEASSKACGDKVWRMPMEEAYWEGMRSKHADMLNTGGREGGSITAALFLKQFVVEGLPWAHLDIAGPVWSEKKGGGTGFGASLLYHWVASHSP